MDKITPNNYTAFFKTALVNTPFYVYHPKVVVLNITSSISKHGKKTREEYFWSQQQIITEALPYKVHVNNFKNGLEDHSNFNSIVKFAKEKFPDTRRYVFQRLTDLKELYDLEEDVEISLESLRNLLLFLFAIDNFKKPILTLNDTGFFQANWRTGRDKALTMRFEEDYLVTDVIFRPGRYTHKRIILNGRMYVLDFKDYLLELKLRIYRES